MLAERPLIAFFIVAGLLTMTPGADTMIVLRNVVRGGPRGGLATTCGVVSGHFLHAVASALGLSVILARSADAYATVKLAGSLYLIWLGLRSLRDAWRGRGSVLPVAGDPAVRARAKTASRSADRRAPFVEGFVSNILNPKTAIFYLAMLPQFITDEHAVFACSMLLAAIHAVQGLVWFGGMSLVLGAAHSWMTRVAFRRWLDAAAGSLLVLLGARLALDQRG